MATVESTQSTVQIKTVLAREIYADLKTIPIFANTKLEDIDCIGSVDVMQLPAGTVLLQPGEALQNFWILMRGKARVMKVESDTAASIITEVKAGETLGEVPILMGYSAASVRCELVENSSLIRMTIESFWRLMASCPVVRGCILSTVTRRLETYQAQTMHREKLISLGTLAAGLMHELNNPGAAARRAAGQLKENMMRLQHVSLRLSRVRLTDEQLDCLCALQEQVLTFKKPRAMSSLEQSDAEDAMLEWLEESGVENAWKLSPTLVGIGWDSHYIECAKDTFPPAILSDALNWLEALISSFQQVSTIEESITRVTDLVVAVKKYAYDDKIRRQSIDVHDSIQSTLTILGHKFRAKQITIEKQFAPDLPLVAAGGQGLNQVWTNILDNAIDAVPEQGKVTIHTWVDGRDVCIGLADDGPGIPAEHQEHIFEPFFTTKPVGVGTGLGLDIAHRIVVGQFSGQISFTSEPGKTEFIVRLPIAAPATAAPATAAAEKKV